MTEASCQPSSRVKNFAWIRMASLELTKITIVRASSASVLHPACVYESSI
jgi:hypothetical protein